MDRACLYQLDVAALYDEIDTQREDLGLTWRALSRELGLSPSLFTRLYHGGRPDADSLICLLVWLGVNLSDLIVEAA